MDIARFLRSFQKYSRRKWFADKYPDLFEEFIDYVNPETIEDLVSAKERALVSIAFSIQRLLFQVRFKDLQKQLAASFALKLPPAQTTPAFLFYHLRASDNTARSELWESMERWCGQTGEDLEEWLGARIEFGTTFHNVEQQMQESQGISPAAIAEIEQELRIGRDLFAWELERGVPRLRLPDIIATFRLDRWDNRADWNDFPAIARTWADECGVQEKPSLRASSSDPAVQQLYPIDPPGNVQIEFGKAAGPADAQRFLFELGAGWFYSGFDPHLQTEFRFIGDLRLPSFWGFLYSNLFEQKLALNRLIGVGAEDMAPDMQFQRSFWIRYEGMLALYRERTGASMKNATEEYAGCWNTAFTFDPPIFCSRYDLVRSEDSLYRWLAYRASLRAGERFREMYGDAWYANARCASRIRDYWREGFRLNVEDVLRDLGA